MKPVLSITTRRDGARVHRLIDDTYYVTRNKQPEIRRDPMVEALFGAPPPSKDASDSRFRPKPCA